MRILLVNTYEHKGGAAIAAHRAFQGLNEAGLEVAYLVQNRQSSDPSILISGNLLTRRLNFLRPYIDFIRVLPMTRSRTLFSTSPLPDQVPCVIRRWNPDIVHLNWITGGFMRPESLLMMNRPIVWTLHDMWAFTGGCHYTYSCNRYLTGCGRCPILHSRKDDDLSARMFRRKANIYNQLDNLVIVTPSRWLASCVKDSPILGDKKITVIPNGLDTKQFCPEEKLRARNLLSLPPDKKLILFGAIRAVRSRQKGFTLLMEALNHVKLSGLELIVFGSSKEGWNGKSPVPVRFMGMIKDDTRLALLYSAADVITVPSVQEVFGQSAVEAMACSTPVVAFRDTGLQDIVKHLETGYLAEPGNPEDFALGIDWVLNDPSRHQELSSTSRDRACNLFDIRKTTRQLVTLYQSIIL